MVTRKVDNSMIENSLEKKNELHTEPPISEKDEVKQAEEELNKSQEHVKSSVVGGLKNRRKRIALATKNI
jgi:hypothetical protein